MDNVYSHITQVIKHNIDHKLSVWYFPVEGLELTLLQLSIIADRYVAILHYLNIKVGDRIGLVLNNGSSYVALLIAIWRLNAVAVPLRPGNMQHPASNQYLQKCHKICTFSLLICEDKEIFTESPEWHALPPIRTISIEVLNAISSNCADVPFANPNSDDIAVLQFSSGSTGDPKAIIVTHGMIMEQLKNIDFNHASSNNNISVASSASWLPMNHDMGLFIGVLNPLYTGCNNILASPVYYMRNPKRWFTLLAEHSVDLTFTTNSALAMTLNKLSFATGKAILDLSCLHLYIAAEKVSYITFRRCLSLFPSFGMPIANIHVGYGMAENALGCACTRNNSLQINRFVILPDHRVIPVDEDSVEGDNLVSIGIADNGHEITIRDSAGVILPELTLGEINVEGPCVTPGYYNNPVKTDEVIIGKRFRTGDLGFYYAGILYFYTRSDDMIIIGGRNIIPDDIEQSAEDLPFIRPTNTCLFAIENTLSGNTELVFLVETKQFADNALKGAICKIP